MAKLKGFTLAEVLVTLGIIGVVASITMPTLVQNYQKKAFATQLHKVYAELSQALLKYQNDRNAVNFGEAGLNSQEKMIAFLNEYLKVVQKCEAKATPCMAPSYRKLSGVNGFVATTSTNCFALASGASLCPRYSSNVMYFMVDVNGAHGPNVQGRDFFTLFVYRNGVIDDKVPDGVTTVPLTAAQRETQFQSGCLGSTGNDLHGCFGKLLNDGWEMTY